VAGQERCPYPAENRPSRAICRSRIPRWEHPVRARRVAISPTSVLFPVLVTMWGLASAPRGSNPNYRPIRRADNGAAWTTRERRVPREPRWFPYLHRESAGSSRVSVPRCPPSLGRWRQPLGVCLRPPRSGCRPNRSGRMATSGIVCSRWRHSDSLECLAESVVGGEQVEEIMRSRGLPIRDRVASGLCRALQ
jgi:hypothetical protein